MAFNLVQKGKIAINRLLCLVLYMYCVGILQVWLVSTFFLSTKQNCFLTNLLEVYEFMS